MVVSTDRLLVANLGDSRAVLGRQKATCSPVCMWPPVSLLLASARQEVLVPFAFLMITSLDDQMNSVALKAMAELWTCRLPVL